MAGEEKLSTLTPEALRHEKVASTRVPPKEGYYLVTCEFHARSELASATTPEPSFLVPEVVMETTLARGAEDFESLSGKIQRSGGSPCQ